MPIWVSRHQSSHAGGWKTNVEKPTTGSGEVPSLVWGGVLLLQEHTGPSLSQEPNCGLLPLTQGPTLTSELKASTKMSWATQQETDMGLVFISFTVWLKCFVLHFASCCLPGHCIPLISPLWSHCLSSSVVKSSLASLQLWGHLWFCLESTWIRQDALST